MSQPISISPDLRHARLDDEPVHLDRDLKVALGLTPPVRQSLYEQMVLNRSRSRRYVVPPGLLPRSYIRDSCTSALMCIFGPEWKFAGWGDAGYGLGRRLIERLRRA